MTTLGDGYLQATLVIGPLSTIEDVDEAACALLGYSRAELLGMHGSELIPPASRPSVAVTLDRLRRGEPAPTGEGMVMRKGGTILGVEVTVSPLTGGRLALGLRARSAEVAALTMTTGADCKRAVNG